MDTFNIIFVTDNSEGRELSGYIRNIGITVSLYENFDFIHDFRSGSENLLMIFDIMDHAPDTLLSEISGFNELKSVVKYVILDRDFVDTRLLNASETMNIELISRPVDKRQFSLLLEKTLLVERYRRMMMLISRESSSRVEIFEMLMEMGRDNACANGSREMLVQVLDFEKNLMKEQIMLNESIRKLAIMRHMEYLAMKDRIKAEEMLADFRRQELLDANRVIEAQESLIDYSSRELHEAQKIIDAAENAAELGRVEAMKLHEDMDLLKEKNRELAAQLEKLGAENRKLKDSV